MRRYLFNIVIGSAVIVGAALVGSAQTGALRGSVKLIGPDGNAAPVVGAIIDVYRTDISGEYHTKTDKSGKWVFAGLPLVGEYVVSVSAPGAQPNATGGIKVINRDAPVDVVLNPGDGKKLSKDEAIAVAKSGGATSSGNTGGDAAAKTKQAEELKKYEAEKNRVTNINETLQRTFKAGQDAINAKNYDEAVKQFDEGLAADPEQVVLYSKKSLTLRLRGVDHYNASVKGTDQAQKAADMESAKKDFQGAVDAANKGLEVANKETPPTDPQAQASQTSKKLEILSYRAEGMRLLVKTDASQGEAALKAYAEYIAAETDPAKKARAERDVAQILFDTANAASDVGAAYNRAVDAYKKILEADPNDTEAILRIGQSLFNIGAINNDKTKYQEAVNYLQLYVDKAADGQLKTEAKELIDVSKAQANVTPEKISTPPRRKRP
ncbi:MAG TPA: carboxypeptidase regulatory-like domain-containing protein [Pyrinomonadaceae bacterium]|jgi:tetratricopeptide (TPR) repeat protein|nr:carboxypeptidase regulatory-like domain-containing protein [Pyrinomonadaceae bacterium]